MPANLENSAVTTGLEKVSFHANPIVGNVKECSNYCTIALISHASKVMLKILHARLQQYKNHELPVMFKLDLEKAEEQRQREMGILEYLTCLLRNLYADQEASVRTGHGTIDWFQIGKGVHQGYILSPCLFNLYTEYIMRNAGLDEAQAAIKIVGRNISNLRYADDTTLMAEIKEELKRFLMKVKEENEKAGFKLNIHKTEYGIWSHHFMANK